MDMGIPGERQKQSVQTLSTSSSYSIFETNLIARRNQIMAYLILLITLLASIFLMVSEGMITGLIAVTVSVVVNVLLFSAVKRKIATRQIPYFVAIFSSFLILYANLTQPELITVLTFALLLLLYPTYGPLLVYSIGSFIQLNVFRIHPAVTDSPPYQWGDNLKLFIPLAVVFVLSILFRQLNMNVFKQTLESEAANAKMETLLDQMRNSIQEMGVFKQKLQRNVITTGYITSELTMGFAEMTKGIESQAASVGDISEAISAAGTALQTVADNSSMMRELSNASARTVERGNEQVTLLSQSILEISAMIDNITSAMDELNEQNNSIGSIVETIQSIASETNRIAKNTAMEAAGAAGHGQSLDVVTAQVSRLAEHSNQSAEEISGRLGNLREKVMQMTNQIEQGKLMIESSESTVKQSEEVFRELSNIAVKVVKQAEEAAEKSIDVANSSSVIIGEVDSISAVTKESRAASREILASVEEQKTIVDQVVAGFERLDELIGALQVLSGMKQPA